MKAIYPKAVTAEKKEEALKSAVMMLLLNHTMTPILIESDPISADLVWYLSSDTTTDLTFLRLLAETVRRKKLFSQFPKKHQDQIIVLLLKRVQQHMSKFPLDDLAYIVEACHQF